MHLVTPFWRLHSSEPIVSVVASKGRHMRSHPQLPLAMPEVDLEEIIIKGKAFEGETSTAEPSNFPSPSIETPFSCS
jgi:hypothetical protein